jgi:succinate-acetate transporter protein
MSVATGDEGTGREQAAEQGDHVRVTLRPYASSLPLGIFAFAVGMAVLGALGLRWLSSPQDVRTAGVLLAAFVFPLQLVSAVFAALARDTVAVTILGFFATSWLALGLANALEPTQQTSRAVGVFLGAFALMLLPMVVTAALSKVVLGAVLAVSLVRAALQSAYELGAPQWADTANGVAALVVVALALYAATAFLLEDVKGLGALVPRRGAAATAMSEDPATQVRSGAPEPGTRQQL